MARPLPTHTDHRPTLINDVELGFLDVGIAWPSVEAAMADARKYINPSYKWAPKYRLIGDRDEICHPENMTPSLADSLVSGLPQSN
jgi:hypothetical protein